MNSSTKGILIILIITLLKAADVVAANFNGNSTASVITASTTSTSFIASNTSEHRASLETNPISFYMNILRSEALTKFRTGPIYRDLLHRLRTVLNEAERNLQNCYNQNGSQLMNCVDSQMDQSRKEFKSIEFFNKVRQVMNIKSSTRSNS